MSPEWHYTNKAIGFRLPETEPGAATALPAIRNDYRWTPACQRAFLEELACTGSVTGAARQVGKSPRSAYDLRFRRDGAAFSLGWEAAMLIARAALADMLMDRAVNGYEEVFTRQEDGTITRGKQDNRLSMALLTRLDRIAEARPDRGSPAAHVALVCQNFEDFLDLVEQGGQGAEAASFLATREAALPPPAETASHRELGRNSALFSDWLDDDEEAGPPEVSPEEEAAAMLVWRDEESGAWKTNFPIPPGAEPVTEWGEFGDENYARTLTSAEAVAQQAMADAEMATLRDAALRARERWFGWREAA